MMKRKSGNKGKVKDLKRLGKKIMSTTIERLYYRRVNYNENTNMNKVTTSRNENLERRKEITRKKMIK